MNFGADQSADAVTYAAIAEQIRALTPRTITGDMTDDVTTMIEYLRTEALKLYDTNTKRAAELDKREKELARRTRDVTAASRVAKAVIDGQPRRLGLLWR